MKTNSKLSSFMLLLVFAWLPLTTSTAQDSGYLVPRTVDGVPDLQGMWTNNTITPLSRPLPERCLMSFGSSSGPPMLPILYNNHYQIVQSPGYVMILVEMVHDVRIIRIDDDPLPQSMRPWMGDSIGHWEGDTLVVESSRFNSNQRFRNSSDNFRVLERFTRVSEQQINYEFTVNDPDTFEQPFSAQIPMNLTADRLYEYACHEGNYSLSGVLAGARLDENEQP